MKYCTLFIKKILVLDFPIVHKLRKKILNRRLDLTILPVALKSNKMIFLGQFFIIFHIVFHTKAPSLKKV